MSETTPQQLADAALAVLADAGLRGLSNAAIDSRAHAAPGECAAVYPDERSLMLAVVDRIVARDAGLWSTLGPLAAPDTVAELAERAATYVQIQVGLAADVVRARVELSLAHPEYVAAGHSSLLDMMTVTLDRLGLPEPAERAEVLVALIDGAVIHHCTISRDQPVPTAALQRAIERMLA